LILLLWPATTLAVLPIAYVVHRFVELPGIALGRRVADRLVAMRGGLPAPAPDGAAALPPTGRVD
jgi:peptidoglycan/LPS O-acetylase OafA/YrhL